MDSIKRWSWSERMLDELSEIFMSVIVVLQRVELKWQLMACQNQKCEKKVVDVVRMLKNDKAAGLVNVTGEVLECEQNVDSLYDFMMCVSRHILAWCLEAYCYFSLAKELGSKNKWKKNTSCY